jgi:apolipoprotein N-acyltransferase
VLAGAGAGLGLAPFDLWPVSLLAFAGMIWIAGRAETSRTAGLRLWLAGTAYFAVTLHWIVEPFFVDAPRHGWMAPFALGLMAGGMALFWGLAGWGAVRLVPRSGAARVWAIAGALTGAEALRAVIFTGFPWAHPGHVLISSELLAVSAWVGPHGLTALVLFTGAAIAHLATRPRPVLAILPALSVIALGMIPLAPPAPPVPPDAPVVRLIQPNAPQHLKWLPEMIPVFFERGLDLTASPPDPALGAPDLVIWPETSLPVSLGRSDAVRAEMARAAGGAAIAVGAQRFDGVRARNTLALLDAEGRIAARYDKHHLVPFGEYMPFGDLMAELGIFGLAATAGGYSAGPGPEVIVLPDRLGRVFPMICYEAIFPGYIRQVPRPDWIVHLTNDAWFGSFSGPYQHLALARLRAAEQGLPVLRAANTGISAVIDSRGRIVAELQLNEAGFLDARLPSALPPTQYSRFGNWPALIVVLLVTGLAALAGRAGTGLRRGA